MFTEAKDDGGGGDNWTTGVISRAKLQWNRHHQTNMSPSVRLTVTILWHQRLFYTQTSVHKAPIYSGTTVHQHTKRSAFSLLFWHLYLFHRLICIITVTVKKTREVCGRRMTTQYFLWPTLKLSRGTFFSSTISTMYERNAMKYSTQHIAKMWRPIFRVAGAEAALYHRI